MRRTLWSRLHPVKPTTVFLLIAAVYVSVFFSHAFFLGKTAYGDGIYYFSWVKSTVVDHDTDFRNEYAYFGAGQPVTPTGLTGNKYSIGPAILWYPWFLWTHLIVQKSGYELPYQLIIGLSGVLYMLTALVLLYRLLCDVFGKTISLAAIACMAFATNLLFYGSIDTVNSHAVSFFASVLFLTFLFQKKRRWFRIGFTLGLAALIRPQDVILGLLVIPYIKPKDYLRFIIGVLYTFSPQLAVWQLRYGTFLVSPYISTIEGFNPFTPHILGVLFSPGSGLFLWTPVVLLGVIGLGIRKAGLPLRLMGIIFLAQLYIISSWSVWWQGASYSGRMFIGTLPLIAFGLAGFFETVIRQKLRSAVLLYAITIPLSVLNILSIVYFLASGR